MKKTGEKIWGLCFPNAIADFAPCEVMDDLKAMGVDDLLVCCSIYAGYRLVMPRNRARQIYSLEEGRMYFRPNSSLYRGGLLQPAPSGDFKKVDILGEAVRAGKRAGIQVSAWVPFFANGKFAKDHPDVAVENLYGSRDRLFLCFNHPEVRRFVYALSEDLVAHYDIASLMIDKIPQTVLELNTISGRIDPILRLLGTICFCEHCQAEAGKHGINLKEARARARKLADSSRAIPPWVVNGLRDELQGDTEIPQFLLEEPLFYEILKFRLVTIREILAEVGRRIRQVRRGAELSACLVPPAKIGHDSTAPRAWLGAQSYKIFADVVDTLHCVIHWNEDVVAYDTRRAMDAVAGKCELCVHLPAYGRVRPTEIAGMADAALKMGADSVAFFCYDLMADEMIQAIRRWATGKR